MAFCIFVKESCARSGPPFQTARHGSGPGRCSHTPRRPPPCSKGRRPLPADTGRSRQSTVPPAGNSRFHIIPAGNPSCVFLFPLFYGLNLPQTTVFHNARVGQRPALWYNDRIVNLPEMAQKKTQQAGPDRNFCPALPFYCYCICRPRGQP